MNAAAGEAIAKQENIKHEEDDKVFMRIMQLSEQDINTRILNKLGDGIVVKLEAAAVASGKNQTDESPPTRGIPRLSGSFAGFHLSDSFH